MSGPDEPKRDDELPPSTIGDFVKVLLVILGLGLGLSLLLLGTCVLSARS